MVVASSERHKKGCEVGSTQGGEKGLTERHRFREL